VTKYISNFKLQITLQNRILQQINMKDHFVKLDKDIEGISTVMFSSVAAKAYLCDFQDGRFQYTELLVILCEF